MNKEEPKVLTRMRLSCCWGDNLNEKELNEVVDYINWLQAKVNQLETNRDDAINKLNRFVECCKAEKLESNNDHLHHQYWDMFEGFNKQVKEILERGKE